MVARPRECPCFSGRRYAECCKPLHDESRAAETPEALMRSRYSAFALGLGRYLVDTVSRDHADQSLPPDMLARELSRLKDKQRFMGLRILSTFIQGEGDAARGEVVFVARIFERGVDQSFVERSRFVREDGEWRYADGDTLPRQELPADLAGVTAETVAPLLART